MGSAFDRRRVSAYAWVDEVAPWLFSRHLRAMAVQIAPQAAQAFYLVSVIAVCTQSRSCLSLGAFVSRLWHSVLSLLARQLLGPRLVPWAARRGGVLALACWEARSCSVVGCQALLWLAEVRSSRNIVAGEKDSPKTYQRNSALRLWSEPSPCTQSIRQQVCKQAALRNGPARHPYACRLGHRQRNSPWAYAPQPPVRFPRLACVALSVRPVGELAYCFGGGSGTARADVCSPVVGCARPVFGRSPSVGRGASRESVSDV